MKNLSCNLGNFRITIFFISFCIISNITAQNNFSVFIKGGLKTSFSNSYVLAFPNPASTTFEDFSSIGFKIQINKKRSFNIIGYFNFREKTAHKYNFMPIWTRSALIYRSREVKMRSIGLGISKKINVKNTRFYYEPKLLVGHHWPIFEITNIYEGQITYVEQNSTTIYTFLECITQYHFNSYFLETGLNVGVELSSKIQIEVNTNFRQSLFQPIFDRALSYELEVNGTSSSNSAVIGAVYSGNAIFAGISINYFFSKRESKKKRN